MFNVQGSTVKKEAKLKKSIALQHDQKDCGAACLLTLVQFHGYHTTLEHLRLLTGTTEAGASLLGLQQAAIDIGFEAEPYKATLKELKLTKGHFILHTIKHGFLNHFVLCLGQEGGFWLVADSEDGVLRLTDEQLESCWTSGVLLKLKFSESLRLSKTKTSFFKSWLLPLLKPHQSRLFMIVLLGLIHAVLMFNTSIFTEVLVDDLLPSKDTELILTGLSIWALVLLASALLDYLRNNSLAQFSLGFNTDLMKNFFGKLVLQPKRFFDSKKTGDLVTRLEDAEGIEENTSKWVEEGLISVFTVTVAFVLFFVYDTDLALINLLLAPILFFAVLLLKKSVIKKQKAALVSHAANTANYIDTFSGIDEVKRGQLEAKFYRHALNFYKAFRAKVFEADKSTIHFGLIIQLLTLLTTITVIGISSFKVASGSLDIGNMLAIISIASITSNHIAGLAFTYVDFEEARITFERMHELLDEKVAKPQNIAPIEVVDHNVLSLHNLSFSFPGQLDMLSNISMQLEQGKVTTLFGESGGGKTTLLNLMSTLYQPQAGRILFNGHSVFKNQLDWRKRIGVVPQEVKIFNASFWENINLAGLGTVNRKNRAKVDTLIKTHHLEAIFEGLPFGIDTILGEGGVRLSGGQRKILGLLRAIHHRPLLLLLDEVTASLDAKNVALIHSLIHKLKSDIPILQVTHSLLVTSKSDYVYVLEKGKIKSEGSPAMLMSKEGDNDLFLIQAGLEN